MEEKLTIDLLRECEYKIARLEKQNQSKNR